MPIHGLRLANVGPFDDAGFEFDEQVNVLVGPNNCGKTTALTALAHVATASFALPGKLLRRSPGRFELRWLSGEGPTAPIGGPLPFDFTKTDWDARDLNAYVGMGKDLGYCKFVPAVRWSTDFRSKGPRPENDKEDALDALVASTLPRRLLEAGAKDARDHLARRALSLLDTTIVRGDVLVQAIVDLDYRAYREGKPHMRQVIQKIAQIASEITEGFGIEFTGVAEDEDGLFPKFSTPDGELPLNCLSQGTQSIIQWLGHLLLGYAQYYDYPPKLEEHPAILIIDEIDAHLHPSWQRRIIPTLTRHFPKLQLFCSTHSPLMLAGLKAGQVQLLRRNEKTGKVEVSRNETDIVGWSADEILRSFLDVESPTDLQTVQDLERLHELRGKKRLTAKQKEELEQLRHKVGENLLGGPIAGEMARLEELLAEAASRATATAAPKTRKRSKKATRRSKTKRSSKTGARAK